MKWQPILPDRLAALGRKLAATLPEMEKQLDRVECVQWSLSAAWAQGLHLGFLYGVLVGVVIGITGASVTIWLLR